MKLIRNMAEAGTGAGAAFRIEAGVGVGAERNNFGSATLVITFYISFTAYPSGPKSIYINWKTLLFVPSGTYPIYV